MHQALHARAPRLLVALLALILVSPLLQGFRYARLIDNILYTVVLLAANYAIRKRSPAFIASVVLAICAFVLLWLGFSLKNDTVKTFALLAYVLFGFVTTAALLKQVVQAETVDFNVLCAAVSVYLLLAVSWAESYLVIDFVRPGSFKLAAGPAAGQFMYFSLVTIASLGYGDITPVGAFARVWSALEAVAGLLFIATLMARLVSVYQRREPSERSPSS